MNSVKVCLISYKPPKSNEFITYEMSWITLLKQGTKIIWQFLCVIVQAKKVIVIALDVEFCRPLPGLSCTGFC